MVEKLLIKFAQLLGNRHGIRVYEPVNDERNVKVLNKFELVDDNCGNVKSVLCDMTSCKLLEEFGVDFRRQHHFLHIVEDNLSANAFKLAEGDLLVERCKNDLLFLDLEVKVVDDDSTDDSGHLLIY